MEMFDLGCESGLLIKGSFKMPAISQDGIH